MERIAPKTTLRAEFADIAGRIRLEADESDIFAGILREVRGRIIRS